MNRSPSSRILFGLMLLLATPVSAAIAVPVAAQDIEALIERYGWPELDNGLVHRGKLVIETPTDTLILQVVVPHPTMGAWEGLFPDLVGWSIVEDHPSPEALPEGMVCTGIHDCPEEVTRLFAYHLWVFGFEAPDRFEPENPPVGDWVNLAFQIDPSGADRVSDAVYVYPHQIIFSRSLSADERDTRSSPPFVLDLDVESLAWSPPSDDPSVERTLDLTATFTAPVHAIPPFGPWDDLESETAVLITGRVVLYRYPYPPSAHR